MFRKQFSHATGISPSYFFAQHATLIMIKKIYQLTRVRGPKCGWRGWKCAIKLHPPLHPTRPFRKRLESVACIRRAVKKYLLFLADGTNRDKRSRYQVVNNKKITFRILGDGVIKSTYVVGFPRTVIKWRTDSRTAAVTSRESPIRMIQRDCSRYLPIQQKSPNENKNDSNS